MSFWETAASRWPPQLNRQTRELRRGNSRKVLMSSISKFINLETKVVLGGSINFMKYSIVLNIPLCGSTAD